MMRVEEGESNGYQVGGNEMSKADNQSIEIGRIPVYSTDVEQNSCIGQEQK